MVINLTVESGDIIASNKKIHSELQENYLYNNNNLHIRHGNEEKIHPDYHEINVMTILILFKTRSTWGKEGDTLKIDIDSKSHPAWTGGKSALNEPRGK